ncbi:hypothetical protein [Chitinophaga sp. YIM B06452]|uniref:hypothetical protein n=1 Tax=Chitinophaga sp. YIM B06452 TaxID=3082158 RepID=UPI0031FEE3B1
MSDLNVNYVRKQLQTSGFGDAVLQDLPEKLAAGLPEVKIVELQEHSDIPVIAQAVLKQGDKPENYFYNGYLATAYRPISIKHPPGLIGPYSVLEGGNNLYVDTRTLEVELSILQQQRLSLEISDPVSQLKMQLAGQHRQIELKRGIEEIERDLQLLMTKEPGIFNRLLVKYEPSVDFDIPDKMLKRQQQTRDRHQPFQYFKTKYGINIQQATRMLAHKVWVYLKLQHEQTGEEYGSWHKINFNKLTPSGNHEYHKAHDAMKYDLEKVLARYAFQEIDLPDPRARQAAIHQICNQIRQGDLPVVTPVNPALLQVRLGANPLYDSLQIFSMLMKLEKHGPYRVPEKAETTTLVIQEAAQPLEVPEGIIAPGTPTREDDTDTSSKEGLSPEKKNSKDHNRRLKANQGYQGKNNNRPTKGRGKGNGIT